MRQYVKQSLSISVRKARSVLLYVTAEFLDPASRTPSTGIRGSPCTLMTASRHVPWQNSQVTGTLQWIKPSL